MVLNYDCVRDILLYVEENLKPNDYLSLSDLSDIGYSDDDIFYSVERLQEAGYLNVKVYKFIGGSDIQLNSISWDGHEFLNNIRDDNTYKEVKDKVKSTVGSTSLSIFASVASAIIKQKLGL